MTCTTAYFNGWGTCKELLKKMNGGLLQTKGNTFTDANAVLASAWQTAIADDDSAVRDTLPIPIMNFENTTDDISIITTALGLKFKDGDPIPSGIIYLNASLCDYKNLHALEGTEYEFIPSFQDGTMWASRTADGTLKGFRCKLAFKGGMPPEDKLTSYPMYIFFEDADEFKSAITVINPDGAFKFSDLLGYTPVALDWRVTTPYSAGDVVVLVTKRGSGEGMTGLVAADFEVMKSNATPTVEFTALVEDGLGYYTLTAQKDNDGTPADLAATDYIVSQCHDDDATNLTYLSHSLKFYGGS